MGRRRSTLPFEEVLGLLEAAATESIITDRFSYYFFPARKTLIRFDSRTTQFKTWVWTTPEKYLTERSGVLVSYQKRKEDACLRLEEGPT